MNDQSSASPAHREPPSASENPRGYFLPVSRGKNQLEDRLCRIMCALSILSPEDVAWAETRLTPAWQRRERNLTVRDECVRAATVLLGMKRPTLAACELERRIKRYAASEAWRSFEATGHTPTDLPEIDRAVHQILSAGDGRPLGWRQVMNILNGRRR